MTQDNRSVTDSATDHPPISTDPSVHRSHGRTDGLTKNYPPLDSVSPNAPRTKTDNEFDTMDGSQYTPKIGDNVTATLRGRLTDYDVDLGIWTLTTDGRDHVPWQIQLHWAQPFKPESTTEATDQVRPVVNPVARIDLDEIEREHREHRAVEWQRCDSDGVPNPEKPLTPFCAACTDEEYVGAIEYGDTIDEGADVVSWPCRLVELAAEVRRLRGQVAELEQLRSADIAVIGKLGAAVATQRPLAELHARYLEVRQHTLSTAGLPYADAVIDQAAYVADEAHELQSAAEDLANDGDVGDATGRLLTTDELLTATRHEIADVALSLVTLANIVGVTVEACIAEKTEADRGRG